MRRHLCILMSLLLVFGLLQPTEVRAAVGLAYDADTFHESVANDGTISTLINLTLTEDTFTVTDGAMELGNHYSASNVPSGLTLVVTGTSGTTATLELTGSADSHLDADDIANMEVAFLDAAFTTNVAEDVANSTKSDLSVDFIQAYSLSYDGNVFSEATANDGTITSEITVTLSEDTFTVPDGAMTLDTHYSVNNVPAGLTLVVTGKSGTSATLELTGSADTHRASDDIDNMVISFLDPAFVNAQASQVANASQSNYEVTYLDPSLGYSGFAFDESLSNDGSIRTTLTLTLSGDTFVDPGGDSTYDDQTDYTISNLPASLSGVLTYTSPTTVTLDLSGNAGSHGAGDSISNLSLTFLDPAFTNGSASDIDNYSRTNLQVNFVDDVPAIVDYQGTNVDYDEADGSPVYVASSAQATETSEYVLFEITGATENEILDVHREGTPSTGAGDITFVGDYVYLGDGSDAEIIGGIDPNNNGKNGRPLKITFSSNLPNGDFLNPEVGGVIPNWTKTSGTTVLGDLATRSQGNPVTTTGSGPYTVTKEDPEGYSFTTDFNYGSGSGEDQIAWEHESIERETGSLTTTITIVDDGDATGGKALQLTSNGSVVSNNSYEGSIRYGSHFGPVIESAVFTANAGDGISLDWRASDQGDHYEVYGFLVNTGNNNHTLLFYGRGESQDWTSAAGTVPEAGDYKFKFVNGTYDKTGGYAVGSYLWIDNIRLFGSQQKSASTIEQIARLVTYESTEPDPAATRTLSLSVENGSGEITEQTATIHINNQFNHPPTLTIGTKTPTLGINTGNQVLLFDSAETSTIEEGQSITGLSLTVETVTSPSDEQVVVDGTAINLSDGNVGTTTSGYGYSVSLAAGTASLDLTGLSLSEGETNTLLNAIYYKNMDASANAGTRTITITDLVDDGGTSNGGDNSASLNLSSQVTLKLTVVDFANTSKSQTTADFSWSEASGATALKIQVSDDGGSTWSDASHDPLTGDATSARVSDLEMNTNYHFKLVVTGGGYAGDSNQVSLRTQGQSQTSDPEPEEDPIAKTDVNDDEKPVSESELVEDEESKEKTVVTTFDEDDLKDEIESLDEDEEKVVKVEVFLPNKDFDVMETSLTGQMVKDMEDKDVTLEIQSDENKYRLPAKEVNIEAVSKSLGEDVDLKDIDLSIKIQKPKEEEVQVIASSIEADKLELLVPPVSYEVRASYGDKEVKVDKFNAFVEREIRIPEGVDPSKITTAVTYKEDGQVLHIPTYVYQRGGFYYARVNSLTNSSYSIIYNQKTFADIKDHWAKETIEDMASRLVVTGVTDKLFIPDRDLARDDFIAMVTRALGIRDTDVDSEFSDALESDYKKEILTGMNYSLILGYGDNTYRGNQRITREEAMVIMERAVLLANRNLAGYEPNMTALLGYLDIPDISYWAEDAVKFCMRYDVVQGDGKYINPQGNLTRAEGAQLVRNMLMQPELIN